MDESLVLRWFCRLSWAPVPDDTTLLRWANTLQPETLHALNDRVVKLARQAKVTTGRKLRLDATCVQTTIHHPTDSGYHGQDGMERWLGLGVIASNLRRIALAKRG